MRQRTARRSFLEEGKIYQPVCQAQTSARELRVSFCSAPCWCAAACFAFLVCGCVRERRNEGSVWPSVAGEEKRPRPPVNSGPADRGQPKRRAGWRIPGAGPWPLPAPPRLWSAGWRCSSIESIGWVQGTKLKGLAPRKTLPQLDSSAPKSAANVMQRSYGCGPDRIISLRCSRPARRLCWATSMARP